MNNKPTLSPCTVISRAISHSPSCQLLLLLASPELACDAGREQLFGGDAVASQFSLSTQPRGERSSGDAALLLLLGSIEQACEAGRRNVSSSNVGVRETGREGLIDDAVASQFSRNVSSSNVGVCETGREGLIDDAVVSQ